MLNQKGNTNGFGNTLLVAQLRLKSVPDKPQIKSNQRAAFWEFHQQIKLKFDMVIIIWLWDPYLFLWHGNKSPTLSSICVKKEFYKFTKDSSLIDWSLDLILFGKWKVCFNQLLDVVWAQGITNAGFSNDKISSYCRHMNNVFI